MLVLDNVDLKIDFQTAPQLKFGIKFGCYFKVVCTHYRTYSTSHTGTWPVANERSNKRN